MTQPCFRYVAGGKGIRSKMNGWDQVSPVQPAIQPVEGKNSSYLRLKKPGSLMLSWCAKKSDGQYDLQGRQVSTAWTVTDPLPQGQTAIRSKSHWMRWSCSFVGWRRRWDSALPYQNGRGRCSHKSVADHSNDKNCGWSTWRSIGVATRPVCQYSFIKHCRSAGVEGKWLYVEHEQRRLLSAPFDVQNLIEFSIPHMYAFPLAWEPTPSTSMDASSSARQSFKKNTARGQGEWPF